MPAISSAGLDAMARKAIELGNIRRGGLSAIVQAEDRVVVKPWIAASQKPDGRATAGSRGRS
jgi:hypothetical protein